MLLRKFLSLLLLTFVSFSSFSQSINKFIGTWQGSLNVGIELRIVFHIGTDGKVTADSPDQFAYGLKCSDATFVNNDVAIEMADLNASYKGRLINDSTIDGIFTQGAEIPLLLKKTEKITERKRPQTPKPPFVYKSEEVEYDNADRSLHYGATITIPEGKGPFPAAVLITGSGPQDRNEEIMGHQPFAVIADHLTRKGFIVLRVDDRGVGKSNGDFSKATSEDFAKDVNNSVDYLFSRPEVDKKKVGLIGHSEGGMIAPMVAAKRKDISYIILMAGPGVEIIELMAEQNEAVAKSGAVSEGTLKEIKPLFRKITKVILESPDSLTAIANTTAAVESWMATISKEVLEELNMATVKQRQEYIIAMVGELRSPWFRYFINFEPAKYLEQLKCKVLALNGDKDIQVVSRQNLPGIEASLKKSRSKIYEVKELPGLNHLFQNCKKCTINEYGELEETIDPVALEAISGWLEKNVK